MKKEHKNHACPKCPDCTDLTCYCVANDSTMFLWHSNQNLGRIENKLDQLLRIAKGEKPCTICRQYGCNSSHDPNR